MHWIDLCGPPGSGKSTLADPIYGPHSIQIEGRLPPEKMNMQAELAALAKKYSGEIETSQLTRVASYIDKFLFGHRVYVGGVVPFDGPSRRVFIRNRPRWYKWWVAARALPKNVMMGKCYTGNHVYCVLRSRYIYDSWSGGRWHKKWRIGGVVMTYKCDYLGLRTLRLSLVRNEHDPYWREMHGRMADGWGKH